MTLIYVLRIRRKWHLNASDFKNADTAIFQQKCEQQFRMTKVYDIERNLCYLNESKIKTWHDETKSLRT
jgi:hypothetical protein